MASFTFAILGAFLVHTSAAAQNYIRWQSLTPNAGTGFVDAANKVAVRSWSGPGLDMRGDVRYDEDTSYATQNFQADFTVDSTTPYKAIYSAIDAQGTPGYHKYLVEFDAIHQDKISVNWSSYARNGVFLDARLLGPRAGVFTNQKVQFLIEIGYYVDPSKIQQQGQFGYRFFLDVSHVLRYSSITPACGSSSLEFDSLNQAFDKPAMLRVVRVPSPGIAVLIAGVYGRTIDLTALGATGCTLGVAEPIFVPLAVQNGTAICPPLPAISSYQPFHSTAQALVVDRAANPAGFTLTQTYWLRW
ncbi:MAG: hypothetical protein KDC95_00995 [Planctomycetes bacterium]|nr:hypothetical protein [Planctomycetota bacterium]